MRPFGRYFVLDLLAEGSMGQVHRAQQLTDRSLTRLVALKRIRAAKADREEFLRMFRSEISLLMRFRHPNIARLYDFGEIDGQPYLTLEYVQGESLASLLRAFRSNGRALPPQIALWIAIQIAAAIEYAHGLRDELTGSPLGIVHRDINPENVLISFEGEVKVIDFGISKTNDMEFTPPSGTRRGNPSYLSPEYIRFGTADQRSDVYSLGIVLWEMLTGTGLRRAGTGVVDLRTIESATSEAPPPSQLNPKCPVELDHVALRALHPDPMLRYASATELLRDLRRLLLRVSPGFGSGCFGEYIQTLLRGHIQIEKAALLSLVAKATRIRSGLESEAVVEAVVLDTPWKPAPCPTPPNLRRAIPPRQTGQGTFGSPESLRYRSSMNERRMSWMMLALIASMAIFTSDRLLARVGKVKTATVQALMSARELPLRKRIHGGTRGPASVSAQEPIAR